MSESNANSETVRLKDNVKTLSQKIAELRLINEMISNLTPITGLDDSVEKILNLLMDAIGGTNIIIYYKTDEQWNYKDIFGENEASITIEDPLVKDVIKTKTFMEIADSDTFVTGVQTDRYSKGATWLYPITAGENLLGIIKMEGIMLDNPNLKYQLQPFINYASLVLKSAIENYSKLKIAYDKLKLNEIRLEALNQLSGMFEASDEEISGFALEQAISLTNSKIGFIGNINETGDIYTVHAWSKPVMELCNVKDKTLDFQIPKAGIWAEAIRRHETVIINDYRASNSMKKGYPDGHIPITRLLSVPVIEGDKVVMAAAVANKEQNYDDFDVLQLSLFINGLWKHFQRKQSDESLRKSLEEKETLLQEIHHRVKNNMQIISSLLKLQSDGIDDDQVKDVLKESKSRVFAMSAVHETLHESENLSEISLKTYLSKITTSIFQTYSINPAQVELKSDVEDIPISINQASPLGLILNELISNSLKYAFPNEEKGEIRVSLKKKDKELELIVKDNGRGISKDFDWKNADSLGLQLVRTLVENQLDGSIDMENQNGTKFIIKFKIAEA